MDVNEEPDEDTESTLALVKNTLLAPVRVAVSPSFLRAYLRTILLLIASFFLFVAAVLAYLTFYYSYIPVRGISVPVYLQYDVSVADSDCRSPLPIRKFPYGIVEVKGLVGRQKYDVSAEIVLPRSRRNLDVGNWMIGVEMRAPPDGEAYAAVKELMGWEDEEVAPEYLQSEQGINAKGPMTYPGAENGAGGVTKPRVLARARRPAILTYRSWVTEYAYRFLRLPLYVLGWRHETETVNIQLMENVKFDNGWRNIPSSLRFEIRSNAPLEVYKVMVRLDAKLEGLRWFMYRHWIISAIVFISAFWVTEMCALVVTWAAIEMIFSGGAQDKIKKEEDEDDKAPKQEEQEGDSPPETPISDTSRTFPTLGSRGPLHFSSSAAERGGKVKEERMTPSLDDVPPRLAADADDEDEDEDADFVLEGPGPGSSNQGFTDSGIGTSMEEVWERGMVRRRSRRRDKRGGG